LKKVNLNWKINEQIRAPELRVVSFDGKQLGVMKREEALAKAKEEGVDLIEIAPMAVPPVVKIIEFGKFRYQEEKKAKKEKKGKAPSDIKEVRFSPFIADHDFENRLERIREFLGDRHKVRIVVKFGGRQMGSKNFGYKVVDKVISTVGMEINVDSEPKFIGRQLICVISPLGKGKKAISSEKENNDKNEDKDEDQKVGN
jgi:translation initiation factor IF-3